MNNLQQDIWLSVHLFYNEPWEEFLQKAIEPYVNTAIQTGIAQQYFFIRYWERGPHIRLRLKGEKEMVNTILKPNLEEHFTHYLGSKPSRRIEPNYPSNFSEELKWMPNNTLSYIDYIPENDRYGGNVGVLLSERQFMLSSKTVLELIKTKGKNWSYDDAMGVAIKLHLSFISSAGLNIEEAIEFFDFFVKNWLPYTFKKDQKELKNEEYIHQSNISIKAFDEAFETQKEDLIPYHEKLWNALENENDFDESILNYWIRENRNILNDLKSEEKNGSISPRTSKYQYSNKPLNPIKDELLWSIYSDFIHLTNNRLGIINKDESYISFMIMRCLEELSKQKKNKVVDVDQQDKHDKQLSR